MKREKIAVRQITCYMSEKDFLKLEEAYKKSLCRRRSQYIRKVLLAEPVTFRTRNSSLDDFTEGAIKLNKYLASLLLSSALNQDEKEELKAKIANIHSQLIKVAELCSQE